jgi:hypothetical protein
MIEYEGGLTLEQYNEAYKAEKIRANDSPLRNLYLILHKVRGYPSFDIAERIAYGTGSDPAPWWIIPTSGHRAYPLTYWKLEDLCDVGDYPHDTPADCITYDEVESNSQWEALRDHYEIVEAPSSKGAKLPEFAMNLVSRLGLAPKPFEFKRRKL